MVFIVFGPTADVASHSVRGIWSLLQKVDARAWISTWVVEFVTNAVMFMPLSIFGNTFLPRGGGHIGATQRASSALAELRLPDLVEDP